MNLHQEVLFGENKISDAGHQGDLSSEDEIARAKARMYTPAGNERRRPSLKYSLQVGLERDVPLGRWKLYDDKIYTL